MVLYVDAAGLDAVMALNRWLEEKVLNVMIGLSSGDLNLAILDPKFVCCMPEENEQ